MQIYNRLKKLEGRIAPIADAGIDDESRYVCDHPAAAVHFYREYPPQGYRSRDLVTKAHCHVCGHQDYLLENFMLTEDQEIRRLELKDGSDYRKAWAYDLELINAGYMDYVPFPPPIEAQRQFSTNFVGEGAL